MHFGEGRGIGIKLSQLKSTGNRLRHRICSVKIFRLRTQSMASTAILLSNAAREAKEAELRAMMRSMEKVLVAYSGGVDSAYLAYIANAELGSNALCVLGISPSVSQTQRFEARGFAQAHSLNYQEISTEELDDKNYSANPKNRCYFCKSELYAKLQDIAANVGISNLVDGTNIDDLEDIRPGRIAAEEKLVRSPLAELNIGKDEIRQMSKLHALETWEKPSSPCLSSRVAHGVAVTRERLSQVENAENVLRGLGFREFRVRSHGDIARIEISKIEMGRILDIELFESVNAAIKSYGFKYVTLDLGGFRSGSLN
jgi:pyridinium-3,5-biscarboxylic acid mononucleotide sulfurtransferase